MIRVIGHVKYFRSDCKVSAELLAWFHDFVGCIFRTDTHWELFVRQVVSKVASLNDKNKRNKGVLIVDFLTGDFISVDYLPNDKWSHCYHQFRMDIIKVRKCPFGGELFEGDFTVEAEGGEV